MIFLFLSYFMVAFSLGFLAMLIARSGYYKTDDYLKNLFVILIFATISDYSKIGFSYFISSNFQQWFLACIATLGVAFAWRKWLSYLYFKKINTLGISNENERGSVLNTIIQDTNIHINGLTVYTKDDRVYSCSDFSWIKKNYNTKLGLKIDETGVSIPVSHYTPKRGEDYIECNINNNNGLLYTYIPISEIKCIDFIVAEK